MERIVCLGPSLRVTKPDLIARAVRADRIRAEALSAAPPESSLEHLHQLFDLFVWLRDDFDFGLHANAATIERVADRSELD
jgi:hypothetical protein